MTHVVLELLVGREHLVTSVADQVGLFWLGLVHRLEVLFEIGVDREEFATFAALVRFVPRVNPEVDHVWSLRIEKCASFSVH